MAYIRMIIGVLAGIPVGVYAQSDEGSGNVVKDISGNGNDGVVYGAMWVDGKFGKALSFDGKDEYIDCGNNASLDIA